MKRLSDNDLGGLVGELRRLWCRVRGHHLHDSWIIDGEVLIPGKVTAARHVWRCRTCTP